MREWPWCKSSLRLYACEISIFSFLFLLTVERKCVLSSDEFDTDWVHNIYLSIYIHIYIYLYYWNRSLFLFYSHVNEHVVWYPFCVYVCVFYVLCFVDNTSTHIHTTKLLMIKVCIWVGKTIEASQMKPIYIYIYAKIAFRKTDSSLKESAYSYP